MLGRPWGIVGSSRLANKDSEMCTHLPSELLMKLKNAQSYAHCLGKQLDRSQFGNVSCRF